MARKADLLGEQITQAIQTLEALCEPHRRWLEHFDRHPESEIADSPLVGGRQRHIDVIQNYEAVIAILRECARRLS